MGRDVVLGLSLFCLAFLPRALELRRFLTPDEHLWFERSIGFLDALSRGDWAGTFQVGHPGITTRWTGVIGLLAYHLPNVAWGPDGLRLGDWSLTQMPDRLMDVLAAIRLPTVLLFSLLIVAVYFAVRRLLGGRVALVAAVLLALDPFCLAMSRVIHHDALSTIFMTGSLLACCLWLEESRRGWLAASGVVAGLAFLSKASAIFLAPMVVVTMLVFYLTRERPVPWRRLIPAVVVWGLLATVVFAALWPAMWVDPVGTVRGVADKAMGYAASPHERDNFFMGRLEPDPGPLFYPLAAAFRLTPLTLVGLAAAVAATWIAVRRRAPDSTWLLLFWLFAVLFTAFMTLGAKKFDRYLLPVFPFLDILAAVGIVEVVRWAAARARTLPGRVFAPSLALVLVAQGASSLPAYPYYLTAYNPLLGGIRSAAQTLLIGWGEGYDQAAAYLNAIPGAEKLNVATWYAAQTMHYLFAGRSWDIRANRQDVLEVLPWSDADYVVVYVNQLQREIPDRRALDFFRSLTPEHVVTLSGQDYAWIYRVPDTLPAGLSPFQYPISRDFGGRARLLGYDVDEGLTTFEGDEYLVMTLYWQCLQPVSDNYRLYLKLVNGVYDVWGEQNSYPIWDSFMTADWKPGSIIRDVHGIVVKPGTPPGEYQVTVDWLQPYTQATLAAEGGPVVLGPIAVPARPAPAVERLDLKQALNADLGGQIRLIGYNLDGDARPGSSVHLTLFWQALEEPQSDYTVFNHLLDASGRLAAQKDAQPVTGFYPTTRWVRGEVVRDQYRLPIPADLAPGRYRLETGLYRGDTGERLAVAGSTSTTSVLLTEIDIHP